ncbi:MAG: hypothetical protein J07HQW2_00748 [Haloquadratum walsbyi J07HQW2]|jgi:hypothetical protein|uniref:Uncharacterized protein n=1 Tax=Haloquadratum walsbyi J07HQW2 TaxID=1238425 RepID=U1MV74_9EURY|nr:MAG: hypothetical protein J07HQW2_00748 [Haloquadratum walsbyi J07HQW2]
MTEAEPKPETESDTEQLDRVELLRTTSECEYLESLADDDDKVSLIAKNFFRSMRSMNKCH